MTVNSWGADVPVSMPQPLPAGLAHQIPMGGFTMTEQGLFHDITRADYERMSRPTFTPYNPQAQAREATPDPEDVDG